MRTSSWRMFIIVVGISFSARAVAAGQHDRECVMRFLPANIDMPHDLAQLLADIYRRSQTFRTQCARIAQVQLLRVTVRLDTAMRSSCRAFTIVRRRGFAIVAEIHVPPNSALFAEMVGHEFEHVLEQLEGLNLRALAQVRGSGVHQVESDLFETDRAQRIGKIVAGEVRRGRAVTSDVTSDE